jgi:hypothetical protein
MATAESATQSIDSVVLRDQMRTEAMRALLEIIAMTQDVFGRIVEIKNDYDPEYPEDVWITLTVEVEATVGEERFEKELEWHRRRAEVSTGWDPFRLYVRRVRCGRSSS